MLKEIQIPIFKLAFIVSLFIPPGEMLANQLNNELAGFEEQKQNNFLYVRLSRYISDGNYQTTL